MISLFGGANDILVLALHVGISILAVHALSQVVHKGFRRSVGDPVVDTAIAIVVSTLIYLGATSIWVRDMVDTRSVMVVGHYVPFAQFVEDHSTIVAAAASVLVALLRWLTTAQQSNGL